MHSLEIQNANKSYGSLSVLRDINISIGSGEFLVLVGPSGCGKSTLLSAIAGITDVTSGRLVLGGRDITTEQPKNRDIAMVFQSYALYPNMTVRDNMGFGLEMRGVASKERNQAIDRVAEQLQLTEYLDRKPANLSGGQRQRVAMGRALVRKPKVFLFDEPLSNLDAKLRVEMRTEIKKLHQRLGATIVYVTHDQVEAMSLATRIAIMRKGEVQQIATPKEVYDTPANTFVASFIGSPSINLFPGRLDASLGEVAVFPKDQKGGTGEAIPIPVSYPLGKNPPDDVLVGLRPEAILLKKTGEADNNLHPISALVEVLEPTGPDTLVVVRWQGFEVTARTDRDTSLRVGSTVQLWLDMNQVILFDAATGNRVC
jgi:multiple sugar transport system ATP-binding protein